MYPGHWARTRPQHPAIVMAGSGETVTYKQLDERSNRLAQLWYDRGLRRGDHVAILLHNQVEYFDAVWAAMRSGLYYTPVNWHLTAPEVDYIVRDCMARSVVVSHALRDAAVSLSDVEIPLMVGGAADGWESYEDAVAAYPATPLDDEPEGAGMFYSSGTTGVPKGILFPLRDAKISEESPLMAYKTPMSPDENTVYLSPAPLYHTAPVVFCSNSHRHGATVVVMERWDPEDALCFIEQYRVNKAQFVPTMFVRMLKLPDEVRLKYDVSSLEVVMHAAAPCPVDVKHKMFDWLGPIIWEYYAGSENVGSTLITPEEWLAHPGSVGLPRMCTVHICDDEHKELPVGEIGRVWFDTPHASFEYHGDPEKTRNARSPEGWYNLGDVGYVDDEGYLYLTDRVSFTIVSGGVNIYPQEAENVLLMHEAVADAAVFGVPNEDLGEEVKGVVQLLDGSMGSPELADELLAFCRSHLAAYKCPRTIDFSQQLPRQETGKLYKRLLRDQYWGDRTSRIV
ncbi:MAG TPA: acyl-CoA synthetase [Acidimicrobiales bacterium]|nr:acyl-CoA synthetase [Acidimicrobiales bacterium]